MPGIAYLLWDTNISKQPAPTFRANMAYRLLFIVVIGASTTLNAVIKFSDAVILALVIPIMLGLFFLFPMGKERLNSYLRAISGIG